MHEIIQIIQTVGFPAAVAIMLLWMYDKKIGKILSLMSAFKEQANTQVELTGDTLELLQTMNTNVKILMDRHQGNSGQ